MGKTIRWGIIEKDEEPFPRRTLTHAARAYTSTDASGERLLQLNLLQEGQSGIGCLAARYFHRCVIERKLLRNHLEIRNMPKRRPKIDDEPLPSMDTSVRSF